MQPPMTLLVAVKARSPSAGGLRRAMRGGALAVVAALAGTVSTATAFAPVDFPGTHDASSRLAAGPDGTAWLVDAGRRVRVSARRADGSAVAQRTVFTAPKGRAVTAFALSAQAGAVTIVGLLGPAGGGFDPPDRQVFALRCTPTRCGARHVLGRTTRAVVDDSLLVLPDARGRTFIAWYGPSRGKSGRTQWTLGSGERYTPVRSVALDGWIAAAAADATGGMTLALFDEDTKRISLTHRGTGAFGAAQRTPIRGRAIGVALAHTGSSTVLAWESARRDRRGRPTGPGPLSVATRPNGAAAFSQPQVVFAGHARTLSLAAAPNGRAVLAFGDAGNGVDADADHLQPYAALQEADGSFGPPTALGPPRSAAVGTFEDAAPDVATASPILAAMTRTGTATVAWTQAAPGSTVASAATARSVPRALFQPATLLGSVTGPVQLATGGPRTFGAWCDGRLTRGFVLP